MKFFSAIAVSIMLVSSASSAKIVRREEHESSGKKQPIRKLGDDSDDSSDETDSPTLSPTVSPTVSPTLSPTLVSHGWQCLCSYSKYCLNAVYVFFL